MSLTGLGGGTYTVASLDILVSGLLSLPVWILNGFITNETKIGLSVSEKQICTLCIFCFLLSFQSPKTRHKSQAKIKESKFLQIYFDILQYLCLRKG